MIVLRILAAFAVVTLGLTFLAGVTFACCFPWVRKRVDKQDAETRELLDELRKASVKLDAQSTELQLLVLQAEALEAVRECALARVSLN